MLDMVTTAAARAIGWPKLGVLQVGHPADFAILDLRTLGMAGAVESPINTLHRFFRTYDGHPVRDLVVGGELVVTNGHLNGVDEASIVEAANAAVRRLYPASE
jgi:cytosine/adenosine deaminase-related metal-dependent hydrolase